MSTVFADSSAVVKLYADEQDADVVRAIPRLAVSQLARVEVPSALWRKHRSGGLSAEDARLLVTAFEADYFGTDEETERFLVIALTPGILDEAARLTAVHGLRAYDAMQLASASAAATALAESLPFVAFDKKLREAALAEGIEVF